MVKQNRIAFFDADALKKQCFKFVINFIILFDPPPPLHQPQLAPWASCAHSCGTRTTHYANTFPSSLFIFYFFPTTYHHQHLKISCHLPPLSSFVMMITPSQAHDLTEKIPLFSFSFFRDGMSELKCLGAIGFFFFFFQCPHFGIVIASPSAV